MWRWSYRNGGRRVLLRLLTLELCFVLLKENRRVLAQHSTGVPIGCVALIALIAMQVSVNPSPRGLRPASRFVGFFQSPLASHHNPASASVSPAGGSDAVSD